MGLPSNACLPSLLHRKWRITIIQFKTPQLHVIEVVHYKQQKWTVGTMDGTCTLTHAFFRVLGKDCECQNTVFLVTTKKDVLKFKYCVMILCLMIVSSWNVFSNLFPAVASSSLLFLK